MNAGTFLRAGAVVQRAVLDRRRPVAVAVGLNVTRLRNTSVLDLEAAVARGAHGRVAEAVRLERHEDAALEREFWGQRRARRRVEQLRLRRWIRERKARSRGFTLVDLDEVVAVLVRDLGELELYVIHRHRRRDAPAAARVRLVLRLGGGTYRPGASFGDDAQAVGVLAARAALPGVAIAGAFVVELEVA